MAVVWGIFEDMSVFYLKELAKREQQVPLLIKKTTSLAYGVCTSREYAELVTKEGMAIYRPVCAASPDEFIGLIMARYDDFLPEEVNGTKKTDLSAGE